MTKSLLPLLLVGASACLLPPPITELPAEQNQPPRIEPTSLRWDPTDGPRTMSTHCASYRFYALVSDPDAEDTLYWRVFVDYHRDRNPLETEEHVLDPQAGDRSLSFSVDPQGDTRFGVAEGRLAQAHTVELFVADRPFYQDERPPLARAVEDGGEVDSFIWTVELSDAVDLDCGATASAP
ncbi:MAG: hypothetical protein AAB426_07485 [Myxococcota bacterium]